MEHSTSQLGLSEDAAIVLALAETAVPFAVSPEDEAERWVRVLRLHGQVGTALQALGVGEAPLETPAQSPAARAARRRAATDDVVGTVARRAARLAIARESDTIATVDLLFAVFDAYRG